MRGREGPKAHYRRIKEAILERIEDGRLAVHDRVPSESELAAEFGVSRMTANRALRELSEAGIVERLPGVGSFVADRRTHGALFTIRDIADEIAERGHQHAARLLLRETVEADETLAARFHLRKGTRLFHVHVLHLSDAVPILLEDRHVNPAVAPDFLALDPERETSYSHLMRVAPLQEVEHAISAVAPGDVIAGLLALEPGEPCLLIRRRTWTRGRVASLADLWHAGSRYELNGRFKP